MISIKDFANTSEKDVLQWLGVYQDIKVKDDFDNILDTNTYDLMMSWYGLQIHRKFNEFPYSVKEIIKTEVYDNGDLQKPVNHFLATVMENMDDPNLIDDVKSMLFAWKIKLNNFLTIFGQKGFVSATAECVVEVMDDPGIVEIKRKVSEGEISIDDGEGEFKEYILTTNTLPDNVFSLMSRTGGVSINQGYQTTVTRGSVTDLNKRILPNPIDAPYAEGIVNLADSLGEKCAGGIALISNGRALKDSEWFHRKLHTVANVIGGIDYNYDCGTHTGIPIKLKSTSQLKAMQGKFAINEDGTLTCITPSTYNNWKKGDTVTIRSTAFCSNLRSGFPCKVCLGKMKASIPYNAIMKKSANLGMFCVTAILNKVGQGLLSTKHFLRNSITIPFEVSKQDREMITSDEDYIYLHSDLCRSGTKLVLDYKIISELSDLKNLESLDDINENQLRSFTNATFQYEIEDPMIGGVTTMQRTVTTSVSTRVSKMSTEFLNYIINKGWETLDKKFVLINLDEIDPETPLFFLPSVHEDLDVYRREIEAFVSFTKRNRQWMMNEVTPEIFGQTLAELWLLIDKKFHEVNIIHSEIILTALLTRDPEQSNYRLPSDNEPRYFRSFTKCIYNRGMGSLLIYQDANQVLESIDSFFVKERQSTQLDCYWSTVIH